MVEHEDTPIVLVVSEDAQQLSQLRRVLRSQGYLTAAARSLSAALSLLTQVQVDGCVLGTVMDAARTGELRRALDKMRPGCPKLSVPHADSRPLEGWCGTDEESLVERLRESFASECQRCGTQPR